MSNRKLYVDLHDELKSQVKIDYAEIIENFDFDNLEESCFKVTVCKTFADELIYEYEHGGYDVAYYLYHEKVVTAFFEWCKDNKYDLHEHFYDTISAFMTNIRDTVNEIVDNQSSYTDKDVQKALKTKDLAIQLKSDD